MVKTGMCDCCYNIHKQLSKKAEFLWNAERYLEDAKKANHAKCTEILEKIVADEKKHLDMLKQLCDDGIC